MRRPYDELLRLMEQDLHKAQEMWGRFAAVGEASPTCWQPRVDLYETPSALIVKAELAGVESDDLDVTLVNHDRVILIRGRRGDPESQRSERTVYHQMEIYLGPFERTVALPRGIVVDRDAIQAAYHEGFLIIRLPKVLTARPSPINPHD